MWYRHHGFRLGPEVGGTNRWAVPRSKGARPPAKVFTITIGDR